VVLLQSTLCIRSGLERSKLLENQEPEARIHGWMHRQKCWSRFASRLLFYWPTVRSIRRSVPTSVYTTRSSSLSSCHGSTTAMLCGLTSLPVQPSAVSAQRCCAIHRRSTTLRPHHRHTCQFPLVEDPGAYSVKLATIVYRSLAPGYLAADLRRLSDMPSRQCLRSSLTDQLDVRQ